MIFLPIFLSQFDVQDKGKAPTVSTEPLATPSDEDILETPFDEDIIETPNVTKMLKKKIKKINKEIMRILDEATSPSEETMKRLCDLRAQARRYKVSSNESLVITKVQ